MHHIILVVYHIKPQNDKPRCIICHLRIKGTDIYVYQKNKDNLGGQSIKLGTWSDAVKQGLV